jgi:glycosyltransferase involved in cell wall biosynthesis
MRKPAVLYLSSSYPNPAFPHLGLWVEGLVRNSAEAWSSAVIAPTPYCPPLPFLGEEFLRYRRIPGRTATGDVEVVHPKIPTVPGGRLRPLEGLLYLTGAGRAVDRLRRSFPFDLIHAHFTYPDAWVGAHLARRYGVPLVTTEHASWRGWSSRSPLVRRQALWALSQSRFHVSVGTALREEMRELAGPGDKLRVIPCGVDGSVFNLPAPGSVRRPEQLLFVGAVRPVKGLDVLLHALQRLVETGRPERLVVVGDPFYRSYARAYESARRLAVDLGISHRVDFVGGKDRYEVARYMQESAAVVLPSRRETLGMVLIEALACGTPVVSTACGGPADIVTDEVGRLVPPEDPAALAEAIAQVVNARETYDPAALRRHALEKFAWEHVVERYRDLYLEALKPA